jgi:hypothetical protein
LKNKNNRRVLWTFHTLYLLGEAVLPNGQKKNCLSSPSEFAPHVKQQLELFWLNLELCQTGPQSNGLIHMILVKKKNTHDEAS